MDEGELFFEGFGAGPIAQDGFYLGEDRAVVGGFFFGDGLGEFADGVDVFGAAFAVDARVAWDEGGQLRWDGGVGFGGFGQGGNVRLRNKGRSHKGCFAMPRSLELPREDEIKEDRQIAPSLREQASLCRGWPAGRSLARSR